MKQKNTGWKPVLQRVTDGTRTRDVQDHNLALYQLSYGHHVFPRRCGANESGICVFCGRLSTADATAAQAHRLAQVRIGDCRPRSASKLYLDSLTAHFYVEHIPPARAQNGRRRSLSSTATMSEGTYAAS